ncbi:uncharacterized protein BKA55DRAFT_628411 [Fusarium redolens]|uniref:Uncharacterized protein n=1 Tax=Fusarium redolens TaxID=48865 RepID=A0A9P9FWL3_FUSRE|nr:uncharacterized protein BKA55DRAFT_628411 [Fusarium redolens]KAH7208452.1 hypothetical protein BKA55DRAFT_628411 [Fusarium redolens]
MSYVFHTFTCSMKFQYIQFFSHPDSQVTLFLYAPDGLHKSLEKTVRFLTGFVTPSPPHQIDEHDENFRERVSLGECCSPHVLTLDVHPVHFSEELFTISATTFLYNRGFLVRQLKSSVIDHMFQEMVEPAVLVNNSMVTPLVPMSKFNLTGLLLSRSHCLRIYVDKINIPRSEPSVEEVRESNNERLHNDRKASQDQGAISRLLISWIEQCKKSIRSHHAALLESDNINYSGFAPPRVTRLLISNVIIIENLIAILQANKDVLLVHILRHSRQQTSWLHELYAWLVCSLMVTPVERKSMDSPSRHCALGVACTAFLMVHCIGFNISAPFGMILVVLGLWLLAANLKVKPRETVNPQTCLQSRNSPKVISGSIRYNGWLKFRRTVANNQTNVYFKVNGRPVRVAWTERIYNSNESYNAVLLVPAEPKMETIDVEGPYNMPMSPYVNGPAQLHIFATDSGILEAYSCFRWRQRFLTTTSSTTNLIWLSADLEFVTLMLEHFHVMSCSALITVIYFVDPKNNISEAEAEAEINEAERIVGKIGVANLEFQAEVASLSELLKDMLSYSTEQYIVGENLRSYSEKPSCLDTDVEALDSISTKGL